MLEDLWTSILDFPSQFVIPDWGGLIALLPVAIFALVLVVIVLQFWRLARAAPARRGKGRIQPRTPVGVHMPGPSFAPIFAAVGAFLLFLGVVFGGLTLRARRDRPGDRPAVLAARVDRPLRARRRAHPAGAAGGRPRRPARGRAHAGPVVPSADRGARCRPAAGGAGVRPVVAGGRDHRALHRAPRLAPRRDRGIPEGRGGRPKPAISRTCPIRACRRWSSRCSPCWSSGPCCSRPVRFRPARRPAVSPARRPAPALPPAVVAEAKAAAVAAAAAAARSVDPGGRRDDHRPGHEVPRVVVRRPGRHAVHDRVRQPRPAGPPTTSRSTRAPPRGPRSSPGRSSTGSTPRSTTSTRSPPARTRSSARCIRR